MPTNTRVYIPMISGSCSCHEHTTNLATGASRLPVLDCGTTFHPGFGGRDSSSTLLDNFWKLISLATEAPSDSLTYRRYINNCIYLSILLLMLFHNKRQQIEKMLTNYIIIQKGKMTNSRVWSSIGRLKIFVLLFTSILLISSYHIFICSKVYEK